MASAWPYSLGAALNWTLGPRRPTICRTPFNPLLPNSTCPAQWLNSVGLGATSNRSSWERSAMALLVPIRTLRLLPPNAIPILFCRIDSLKGESLPSPIPKVAFNILTCALLALTTNGCPRPLVILNRVPFRKSILCWLDEKRLGNPNEAPFVRQIMELLLRAAINAAVALSPRWASRPGLALRLDSPRQAIETSR